MCWILGVDLGLFQLINCRWNRWCKRITGDLGELPVVSQATLGKFAHVRSTDAAGNGWMGFTPKAGTFSLLEKMSECLQASVCVVWYQAWFVPRGAFGPLGLCTCRSFYQISSSLGQWKLGNLEIVKYLLLAGGGLRGLVKIILQRSDLALCLK